MKYLVIGDPHLTHKNMDKMKILCEYIENKGLPTIWLGDMLDTKEVIRGKCLDFWHSYFKNSKLNHIILVGNHDLYNLHSTEHSLGTLKTYKNVTVIDSLQKLVGMNIWLTPYVHDKQVLLESLKDIPEGAVLFGHLELNGFDFGNGQVCKNDIDSNLFSKFSSIITGHFHKYQQLGNVTYLGTPFSHSFGESDQVKYIATFDTDGNKLELIESLLPRHRTFEISVTQSDTTAKIKKKLSEIVTQDVKNDYVRVVLNGYLDDLKKIKVKDVKLEYPDIKFSLKPIPVETGTVVISENTSNSSQFQTWATTIKKLDENTLKLGLDILKEIT